jgi:hypothetical protein
MTNAMPAFTVLVNKLAIGRVSAVSHAQAMTRARALARAAGHARFEIEAEGNVTLDRAARTNFSRSDTSYSAGRAPYATPGFEERRAAMIAAYKAGAL